MLEWLCVRPHQRRKQCWGGGWYALCVICYRGRQWGRVGDKLLMGLNQHWLCCWLIDIDPTDGEAREEQVCTEFDFLQLPFRHLADTYGYGFLSYCVARAHFTAQQNYKQILMQKIRSFWIYSDHMQEGSSSYCTVWLLHKLHTHTHKKKEM